MAAGWTWRPLSQTMAPWQVGHVPIIGKGRRALWTDSNSDLLVSFSGKHSAAVWPLGPESYQFHPLREQGAEILGPFTRPGPCVLSSAHALSRVRMSCLYFPLPGCQAKLHFCDSGPCKNNGICSERWGGFSCDCPVGFGGKDCRLSEWAAWGRKGLWSIASVLEVKPVTPLLLSHQLWPIPTISVATEH